MGHIKAKTHLEKLGFKDSDKMNADHDTIQIWTAENIREIISKTVMHNNPHDFKVRQPVWEDQVMNVNRDFKQVVGFIDLWTKIQCKLFDKEDKEWFETEINVFIEVKTQIKSLGELIRQMRAYQAYEPRHLRNEYIIVSPDDKFQKLLNQQGFYFHKYQDPTKLF
ncbi:MAG: hypothetical protein RJQ00_00390 [Vicingaceae bacterium]